MKYGVNFLKPKVGKLAALEQRHLDEQVGSPSLLTPSLLIARQGMPMGVRACPHLLWPLYTADGGVAQVDGACERPGDSVPADRRALVCVGRAPTAPSLSPTGNNIRP